MRIALITITHNRIGEEILRTAEDILGSLPMPVRHFSIMPGDSPDRIVEEVRGAIQELDDGAGVLILSDLFGSTPCNIAHRAGGGQNARVVSGISLPMVLRACNYANRELQAVANCAAEGGYTGVNDYAAGSI